MAGEDDGRDAAAIVAAAWTAGGAELHHSEPAP